MKSKRWKRRNRHTRPEWVDAYWFCDFMNDFNGSFNNYWYSFMSQNGYGICSRRLNTTLLHRQTQLETVT